MKNKNPVGRPKLADELRADQVITLRVTLGKKKSYTEAAKKNNQTLTAWIFGRLDGVKNN